jgi:glycosyltransferase involved in cell wall biosynthesis
VRAVPLARVFHGPAPAGDRIFHHGIWFRGHNNARYDALLPRLDRLDVSLMHCSDRRLLRALQYNALSMARGLRYRLVVRTAGRRYKWLLALDPEQVPFFGGRAVVDLDDPRFTAREAALLNHPRVAAYVVTAERAARRLQELGVRTPHAVVPQGFERSRLVDAEVEAVARRFRTPGDTVVGYVAAWLGTANDKLDQALYGIDHLIELWDAVRARLPRARLWLVGAPTERVRRRLAGRPDVWLAGHVPHASVLSYVKNFDVALYPRTADQGMQAAKVAEYMGLGIPTVSYDLEVTEVLARTGAGVLVRSAAEFVEAVVVLATDADRHGRLAHAARAAAGPLDWDVLAERYQREVLDRYLRPPA